MPKSMRNRIADALKARACPWCGAPAYCLTVYVDDLVGRMEQVHCCGIASGARCQAAGPLRLSAADAVKEWNRMAVAMAAE